ncbi:MAG TPA: cytochrome c oxidase assembly protein [Anaerolineales bacterium]|nr:cytochrome c oxidase assembly protein [Anaerolineales bacterium]
MLPEFFTAWNFRPAVIVGVGLGLALYSLGWARLRKRGAVRLATIWRLIAYWLGMAVLFISLTSGLDIYGEFLLLVHMSQHLLLMGIAPLLIMASNPFPFVLWGLPFRRNRWAVSVFGVKSELRELLKRIASPGIVGFLYIVITVGWHDPGLYQRAIAVDWVHDLEHLSFYLAAALLYWQVLGAGPQWVKRPNLWLLILLLVLTNAASMAVGVAITLASEPIYPHYAAMPRLWGLSVMDDQNIAGLLMWLPGGVPNTIAGIWLLWKYFRGSSR